MLNAAPRASGSLIRYLDRARFDYEDTAAVAKNW